ncbi:GNAT family N-acetyltransferase [Tepidibacter mesophilus]|uniref:GNAT family N-acetyltransferase n=1 Tax=Tepidibacter mesophilus TaxID=655607 RepID=UPI000C0716AE|nr:GNAT family N-acetyltransferase [Tepidibacter mesophilus]
MEVRIIHNTSVVYKFLENKAKYNYIYQLNYLSIKEWDNVVCYGLFDNLELKQIAILIINYEIPVLLAASFENEKYNTELVKRIKNFLPAQFYTHINRATLESVFSQNNIFELEEYMNMGLCDYKNRDEKYENEAVRLGFNDLNDIKELIMESYPEAWLDDNLVKLDENFGIYDNKKLISFAGIHAYSEEYQVATVAHITTHPDYRKRGYGEKVVYSLLKSLKNKIKFIGLNVKVNNFSAINCYKKLGFKEFGKFIACTVENNI